MNQKNTDELRFYCEDDELMPVSALGNKLLSRTDDTI